MDFEDTERQESVVKRMASDADDDDDHCKKNKGDSDEEMSTQKLEVVDIPRQTRTGEINVLIEGNVGLVSLCVSKCGKRAWARKRDDNKLVYCDLYVETPAWIPAACQTTVGEFGMTRCGASEKFIAVQAHQTGLVTLTDGDRTCYSAYLLSDEDIEVVKSDKLETDQKIHIASLKALMPVHNIGIVAVVEGVGVVFIAFQKCFISAYTATVLYRGKWRPDAETGTDIEATISVHNHLVAIAQKTEVVIINMGNGQIHTRIPISGLGIDDRVWQLELKTSTLCISTPECVLWFHTKTNKWFKSEANAAIACHASDTHNCVAMITAVGDVVAIDTFARTEPKRLKQGTPIQPFVSTHTRDCIAGWGGMYSHTLKLIKTGGEVHEVIFK